MQRILLACVFAVVAASVVALGTPPARAQIPSPPATFFGSITDSAGPIPAGVRVEAYVGDRLCGTRETELTGDGAARVTVYSVHVVSASQTAGCGTDGALVRMKVGDRFAEQTGRWRAGPLQVDLTFGDATPAPIPSPTPTPTRTATATVSPRTTPLPRTPAPAQDATPGESPGAIATIGEGTPGAGSPVPTLRGGVTSSTPAPPPGGGASDGGGGGGFPVWGVIVLVLGGIAVIGGGVGFAMARGRRYVDAGDGPA